MNTDKECAHPACTCRVPSGRYCSGICEDAGGLMEIACECVHAECGATAVETAAG